MWAVIIVADLAVMSGIAWLLYERQEVSLRPYYWPALLFKLAAGVVVGLLYFYYYGAGDTISYWHDGKLIAGKMGADPIGTLRFFQDESPDYVHGLESEKPRSLFFVKISGVMAFLSGGNYWMMSAMLSLLSFLGAWYLFSKISGFFPATRLAAAFAFLFYPSVVFWSSGLIKESVGLGALLFLTGILLSVIRLGKINFWEWCLALASLWFGWTLKYYWVGVFLPVAITTLVITIVKRSMPSTGKYELGMWVVLFLGVLLLGTSVHPNFYPNRFLDVIWQSNSEFMALTRAENAIHYYDLQPTFPNVLMNSPWAFLSGLFRPFAWEFHNLPSFAAGMENLMLMVLVLTSLWSLSKLSSSPERLLIVAAIVYVVLLSVFLALATPNLGTLSRYKIGFLPFLVFLAVHNSYIANWMRNQRLKH